jgi:TctA family transporter
LVGEPGRKLECEPALILLGFILGPMMEEFLHRALLLSKGSPLVLITRPISATLLIMAALSMLTILLPALRKNARKSSSRTSNRQPVRHAFPGKRKLGSFRKDDGVTCSYKMLLIH